MEQTLDLAIVITPIALKKSFPPTLWWQESWTIFSIKEGGPSKREKAFKFRVWQDGMRKGTLGKRQSPHWHETLSTWHWELKGFLEGGKETSPAPSSLVGCLAPQVGRSGAGTSSPLLHYFIRLLTNKHMETIHPQALITFSFKGMAGRVSSVKNYLNPPLTLNPPSHFPKFLSHAFQRVWLLSLLHDFAQSILE